MRLILFPLGCVALALAGPASAQQGAAVSLVPSAAFAPGGRTVQELVRKRDFIRARAVLPDAETKASTPADHYLLGNFRFEIGRYFNDAAMQRTGLETMLASGLAAPADAARFHYYAGQFALNAKDFAGARLHLLAAERGDHGGASTQVYLAESYFGQARDHVEGEGLDPAGRELVRQGLPHLRRAIAMERQGGRPINAAWAWRGLDLAQLAQDPDVEAWRDLAAQTPGRPQAGLPRTP